MQETKTVLLPSHARWQHEWRGVACGKDCIVGVSAMMKHLTHLTSKLSTGFFGSIREKLQSFQLHALRCVGKNRTAVTLQKVGRFWSPFLRITTKHRVKWLAIHHWREICDAMTNGYSVIKDSKSSTKNLTRLNRSVYRIERCKVLTFFRQGAKMFRTSVWPSLFQPGLAMLKCEVVYW